MNLISDRSALIPNTKIEQFIWLFIQKYLAKNILNRL